jgi:hypothetical protein
MTINLDTPIIILLLAGIYALWTFGFRRQFLDITRSKLFTLRSELFNLALDGRIKFDDPAYRLTESYLNGIIRYAHQITFLRVIVRLRLFKNNNPASIEFAKKLSNSIIEYPDKDIQIKLSHIILQAGYLTLRQAAFSNFITFFAWGILVAKVRIKLQNNKNKSESKLQYITTRFSVPKTSIEDAAYCFNNQNCII